LYIQRALDFDAIFEQPELVSKHIELLRKVMTHVGDEYRDAACLLMEVYGGSSVPASLSVSASGPGLPYVR
jgi:hypothetical protein